MAPAPPGEDGFALRQDLVSEPVEPSALFVRVTASAPFPQSFSFRLVPVRSSVLSVTASPVFAHQDHAR
jgi:hypothetical protein